VYLREKPIEDKELEKIINDVSMSDFGSIACDREINPVLQVNTKCDIYAEIFLDPQGKQDTLYMFDKMLNSNGWSFVSYICFIFLIW